MTSLTAFPREPVRAIVINPDRERGGSFIVGSLERCGGVFTWLDQPTRCSNISTAWTLARTLRDRSGLPLLDRHDAADRYDGPSGGMAA